MSELLRTKCVAVKLLRAKCSKCEIWGVNFWGRNLSGKIWGANCWRRNVSGNMRRANCWTRNISGWSSWRQVTGIHMQNELLELECRQRINRDEKPATIFRIPFLEFFPIPLFSFKFLQIYVVFRYNWFYFYHKTEVTGFRKNEGKYSFKLPLFLYPINAGFARINVLFYRILVSRIFFSSCLA